MPNKFLYDMPRRVLPVFLILDSSGSMQEYGRIDKVNRAIEEMIPRLMMFSDELSDVELRIAVLSFSDSCRWHTIDEDGVPELSPLDDLIWIDIEPTGPTFFGNMLDELNSALSRKTFLKSSSGYCRPILILLSDGCPGDNYKHELEELWQNRWFKGSIRIAIACGEDPEMLASFTGDSSAVIMWDAQNDLLSDILTRIVLKAVGTLCWEYRDEIAADVVKEIKYEIFKDILKKEQRQEQDWIDWLWDE